MAQIITKQRMLAAILMGGMVTVLTSCTDREDNPVQKPQTAEEKMKSLYGENKEITNGDFDQSLAVKCINGTFVGKKTDDHVIAFKGIPFVGKQPVGDLRWKAPVDIVPDESSHRKAIRQDLLKDHAQDVGSVCQDRQSVA